MRHTLTKSLASTFKVVFRSASKRPFPCFRMGEVVDRPWNASVASSKGFGMSTVYSATKAAVRSFARTWTVDLKQRRIRVNAISPGPIDTPIFNTSKLTDEQIEQFKAGIVSAVPMGRMGNPDEVAKADLFLATDDSIDVTGIELFVDGGMAQIWVTLTLGPPASKV